MTSLLHEIINVRSDHDKAEGEQQQQQLAVESAVGVASQSASSTCSSSIANLASNGNTESGGGRCSSASIDWSLYVET